MTYAAFAGYSSAIGAIGSAYSAYAAGKSRQLAYENEAAMAALNARQVQIDTQFVIADKMNELADNLALQQVVAAAQGRSGGSVANLAATSVSNFKKEEERLLKASKLRSTGLMMESEVNRASGKTAAASGLMGAVSELATGIGSTAKYFLSNSTNDKA